LIVQFPEREKEASPLRGPGTGRLRFGVCARTPGASCAGALWRCTAPKQCVPLRGHGESSLRRSACGGSGLRPSSRLRQPRSVRPAARSQDKVLDRLHKSAPDASGVPGASFAARGCCVERIPAQVPEGTRVGNYAPRLHSGGARRRASFHLRSGAPLPAAVAAQATLPGGCAPPRPRGGHWPPLLALRANEPVCSEALPPNLRCSPAQGLGVVPGICTPMPYASPRPAPCQPPHQDFPEPVFRLRPADKVSLQPGVGGV
jgi:hypothetical protein